MGTPKRRAREQSALRKLRGDWTLREIERVGRIDKATLLRAETGKEPTLTTALRIARFYETTVEKLWGHLIE